MAWLYDNFPSLVFMVGKKAFDTIKNVKDLAGTTVGVTALGSSTHHLLNDVQARNNILGGQVNVTGLGTATMAAAFKAGTWDDRVKAAAGEGTIDLKATFDNSFMKQAA